MASFRNSIIGLVLFNIIYSSYAVDTTFTQERRIEHKINPAVADGQRFYTYFDGDTTVVTSDEPGFKECKIPKIVPPNDRHELGNGKMVAFTILNTHFSILDLKTCSAVHVGDDKPYKYSSDKEIDAVIPHQDTFDIYSLKGDDCRPCRYNDKGERVEVKDKLKSETKKVSGYFLAALENISGLEDKYLYAFSENKNDSTTLRILDSQYNVVKERTLKGQFKGFSLTHGHITVCNAINLCRDKFYDCYSLECQFLDSNLGTTATATLHQPENNQYNAYLRVNNVEDGGAIVATEFDYFEPLSGDKDQNVFVQQIHANGEVEPAINFGDYKVEYLTNSAFTSKNGEYCLVTGIEETKEDKQGHTLIKCINSKATKKD